MESRMPITAPGAQPRIASVMRPRKPALAATEPAPGQVAVGRVQLDDLESGGQRVDRRDPEALDDRIHLAVGQRAGPGRLAWRAHRRRGDRRKPHVRPGRLAAQVHELAGRHRALTADRLRAGGHARHGLLPPRLGHDPASPGGLRRRHRAADYQHRGAAGRAAPPVLGVPRQGETVGDQSRGVGRADQPVTQHHAAPEREQPARQWLAYAHHDPW
jgi:hypothetical protein